MNFSKFKTAKKVWDYLKEMYLKSNFANQYELEMFIHHATQTGMSIQEFYNEIIGYWDHLALMEPFELQSIDSYIQYREKQRLV